MIADRPVARIEHVGHRRIRARVVRQHRSPEAMEQVRRRLSGQPEMDHVEVNAATGSVLVHCTDTERAQETIGEALELVRAIEGEAPPEQGVDQIVGLVRTAEQRLRFASTGRLSLRWLVPAVFVAAGVRQLLRRGLTLGTIPWYVLLYYGLDSFLKHYPEHAPQTRPKRPETRHVR